MVLPGYWMNDQRTYNNHNKKNKNKDKEWEKLKTYIILATKAMMALFDALLRAPLLCRTDRWKQINQNENDK